MKKIETILQYLSENIKKQILKYLEENENNIEEIRIRNEKPLAIKTSKKNISLKDVVSVQDTLQTFQKICENSIYSYKKQICDGYITIKNGHRIGITGNCVVENGQVININYISSLNIRVAREKKGCSDEILKYIIDIENKKIYNTLIVSKPGCGKTTILRDLIRNISNGISKYNIDGKNCSIIDERGEISAMNKGICQNDVGIFTDVIENVPKSKGMNMAVRSMAPDVLACDEIGSIDDIKAINYAVCSGVKGIFTAHGENIEELLINYQLTELLQKFIIEKIIFLDSNKKGKMKHCYYLDKKQKKYIKEF